MKRTVRSKIDTDWTMLMLLRCLHSDSKSAIGHEVYPDLSQVTLAEAREYIGPSPFCWNDPYKLKWHIQLRDIWQRYRFSEEPLTSAQLTDKTLEKFRENLVRVRAVDIGHPLAQCVLRNAKQHVARILGNYCEDEMMLNCKFGSRSTVGNPLAKAYLDLKLAGPITGSWKQLEWFYNCYLPNDHLLAEVVSSNVDQEVSCLKVALAPKSWKIMRPILPNTLIGNFHSAGVGNVIVNRLKSEGLDIRVLQEKHKKHVKAFSRTRSHVTADLSSASDSITRDLVKALLPSDWYSAVDLDTFPTIEVGGKVEDNPCFCTMGIGYTFPLQTLIFYSLLLAIKELARCTSGFCSVYGDDLIYPRKIHKYVTVIFPLLGFILNKDKTYAEEYFRESCGADFYRGVDVRPFKPMATCERLNYNAYSRFIYKLINGILNRWEPCEVSQTLHFLYREIANSTWEILAVPPSFPDSSGFRLKLSELTLPPIFMTVSPKWAWHKRGGQCAWRFSRLVDMDDSRTVRRQLPFYWQSLRSLTQRETALSHFSPYASSSDCIRWVRIRGKLIPYVTRKERKHVARATSHTLSWI